jgi:predicted transcriptional regulator
MSKTPKLVEVKVRIKPSVKRTVKAMAKKLNCSQNRIMAAAITAAVMIRNEDPERRDASLLAQAADAA